MQEIRQLKQLQSQLNVMNADLKVLEIAVDNARREHSQKLAAINRIKGEINKLNANRTLKVSEHAIVRYFERVMGFDIGQIETKILSENVEALVNQLGGNGTYPNGEFSVIIKDFTVTTVV